MDFASDSWHSSLGRAGELLRVLTYVAEPLRDNPSELPLLDSTVQTEFFEALSAKFAALVDLLKADARPNNSQAFMNACILLARFLQFDLAFRGVWTGSAKKTSETLSSNLFTLIQVCCSHLESFSLGLLTLFPRFTLLGIIVNSLHILYYSIPYSTYVTVSVECHVHVSSSCLAFRDAH